MRNGDVYIDLGDRQNIKLKPTPIGKGEGTVIPNGAVVVPDVSVPISDDNFLVNYNGQKGYIQRKYLKVAINVLNDKPVLSMTYNHPVQSLASSAVQYEPPAQYASSPVPVQSAQPQSDAPPDYNSVMKNLENYPVVYQDPYSLRFYAVDKKETLIG